MNKANREEQDRKLVQSISRVRSQSNYLFDLASDPTKVDSKDFTDGLRQLQYFMSQLDKQIETELEES